MSHTVIITRRNAYSPAPLGGAEIAHVESVDYSFSFEPSHADTDVEVGDKVAKILKHLKKAEAIANGHSHDD